jgi:hypothetical protein
VGLLVVVLLFPLSRPMAALVVAGAPLAELDLAELVAR